MAAGDDRFQALRETLQEIRQGQRDIAQSLQVSREEAAGTRQQVGAASAELDRARAERAGIAERLTRVEGRAAACDLCASLQQRVTTLEAQGQGAASTTASWAVWLGVAAAAASLIVSLIK